MIRAIRARSFDTFWFYNIFVRSFKGSGQEGSIVVGRIIFKVEELFLRVSRRCDLAGCDSCQNKGRLNDHFPDRTNQSYRNPEKPYSRLVQTNGIVK